MLESGHFVTEKITSDVDLTCQLIANDEWLVKSLKEIMVALLYHSYHDKTKPQLQNILFSKYPNNSKK